MGEKRAKNTQGGEYVAVGEVAENHPGVEPALKEHPPSRRLDELPVLLALAAIILGAVALPQLLVSQPPGNDSPEAGFTRDMMIHHA